MNLHEAYSTEKSVQDIIFWQEQHGVLFDVKTAEALVLQLDAELEEIRARVEPALPERELPKSQLKTPPMKRFKVDGTPSALAVRYFDTLLTQTEDGWVVQYPSGPVPLAEATVPLVTHGKMSLSNLDDIKDWLISLGWEPTMYNRVKDPDGSWRETSPMMVDPQKNVCPSLIALGDKVSIVQDLTKWLSLRNRRNILRSENGTGWLHHPRLQKDSRLPASANTIGANTNRFTHKVVVNVPRVGTPYGEEFRGLYIAPEGKLLLGWDASALEARITGHYTAQYDQGKYARELLEGDIHTKNMHVFQITSRSIAKNGYYALCYGAQPAGLAATIGKPVGLAKQIFEDFWEANTALAAVRDAVKRDWERNARKFITGLDGRPIITRSEHSLVNALFQSAGAICMKRAMVLFDEQKTFSGVQQVLHMHDEQQNEVPRELIQVKTFGSEDEAKAWDIPGRILGAVQKLPDGRYFRAFSPVGELGILTLRQAGEELGLRVPLDGEYKVGVSWAGTH